MSLSWPCSSGPSATKRAAGDGFDYGFDLIRHPRAAGDWCLRMTRTGLQPGLRRLAQSKRRRPQAAVQSAARIWVYPSGGLAWVMWEHPGLMLGCRA